jgi:hypothetical protein
VTFGYPFGLEPDKNLLEPHVLIVAAENDAVDDVVQPVKLVKKTLLLLTRFVDGALPNVFNEET